MKPSGTAFDDILQADAYQVLQADRGRKGVADPDCTQVRFAEKPAIAAGEETEIGRNRTNLKVRYLHEKVHSITSYIDIMFDVSRLQSFKSI